MKSNKDFIIYNISGCTDVRTVTTIGIGSGYGDRYLGTNHFRDSRYDTGLHEFFFKPNLRIVDIVADEAPIMTGAFRKYMKITVVNIGRAKAENCDATLTLISHNSTSQLQPSPRGKNVVWDNGEYYRTIGAKQGFATLNVIFSQDSFARLQEGQVAEERKIYAKVATIHSLNYFDSENIQYASSSSKRFSTDF